MQADILSYFKDLQKRIIRGLETFESGQRFKQDDWQKQGVLSGQGCTAILEDASVFERAGVAFSHVLGQSLPPSASTHRQHLVGRPFEAVGVSLVLHPRNPYAPTVHMNVRCFFIIDMQNQPQYWFGGGMDLTPYYGFKEDCVHFHQNCYDALAPFTAYHPENINYYTIFKKQCDDYFYLKHRQEARGIGGIFFDDFNELGFEKSFALTQAVGNQFLKAYTPILNKRQHMPYDENQRRFQALRRGRYVEFNLVFDRGTLFGLQSGGRTESILMSMPPNCAWAYQAVPAADSLEEKLYTDFLPAKNWLNL